MSAKYERIKQADLALPAPLRWLTRAFSSITLAVTFLVLVFLYGVIGSIPFFFLMVGGIDLLIVLGTVGVAGAAAVLILRRAHRINGWLRLAISLILVGLASAGALKLCLDVYGWAVYDPFMMRNSAEVIYRLPYFEMTQQQFYAWWPLRLILILFVFNLIWATIRRIEFRLVNLGVLTVHTGIVILAIGAILYGRFRVSGDTLVWRQDLGGRYQHYFYDKLEPALYITHQGRVQQLPLPHLPRYNDYPIGSMHLALSDRPDYRHVLPSRLHMSIPGFVAYGTLAHHWKPAQADVGRGKTSPIITLRMGTRDSADGQFRVTLAANEPAKRVISTPAWAIEYVVGASAQRIADLMTPVPKQAPVGMIVKLPGDHFRKAYAIHPGETITVGHTGYRLHIQSIGPYRGEFAAPSYRGASDFAATVRVTGPGTSFTRVVLYRYPSQSHNVGPDGSSFAQSPSKAAPIKLVLLDNRTRQFHLFAKTPQQRVLRIVADLPGGAPVQAMLTSQKFLLGQLSSRSIWLHVTRHLAHAEFVAAPQPTPKLARHPKEEGTYLHAIVPVRMTLDRPAKAGGLWQKTVWLTSMRYPMFPDAEHHPVTVNVPGVGPVKLAFSRRRYRLPFEIALARFKMIPIAGSHIPQDFHATLHFQNLNKQGKPVGPVLTKTAQLNAPVFYHDPSAPLIFSDLKISQAGWDPPTPGDPNAYAKNAEGQYINQQRFAILGVGNNLGISIIFFGGCLIVAGVPWAFYVKPWLLRRKREKTAERTTEQPVTIAKAAAEDLPKGPA